MNQALGIIESRGLASALEAADTAVKAANVELIGYEKLNGNGMIAVKIFGDVGAVKAAVDAASKAASQVCEVSAKLVIPSPDSEADKVIFKDNVYYSQGEWDDLAGTDLDYTDIPESDFSEGEKDIFEEVSDVSEGDNEIVKEVSDVSENEGGVSEESEDDVESKDDVCNLCKDPACPRRKGEPHTTCIHYMDE